MNKTILMLLAYCCVLTACGQKKKNDFVVTIRTPHGDMTALLYDETPLHKANFIRLVKEKYYDSLLFHRVIPQFMIQGGDPDSKRARPGQSLGMGGPAYTIEAEFRPEYFHEKGALSAARLPDQMNPQKESSGSQFYIVQGRKMTEAEVRLDPARINTALQQFFKNENNRPLYDSLMKYFQTGDMDGYGRFLVSIKPRIELETGMKVEKDVSPEKVRAYTTNGGAIHLDGTYTVFGKVIKGLEVIDKIAAEPTSAERPLNDIRMFITVEEMPRAKIEKKYGYKYPDAKPR